MILQICLRAKIHRPRALLQIWPGSLRLFLILLRPLWAARVNQLPQPEKIIKFAQKSQFMVLVTRYFIVSRNLFLIKKMNFCLFEIWIFVLLNLKLSKFCFLLTLMLVGFDFAYAGGWSLRRPFSLNLSDSDLWLSFWPRMTLNKPDKIIWKKWKTFIFYNL